MKKKMTNKIVLDASALLMLINQEKGAEKVEKYLPSAVMSSVNVCEVLTVLLNVGFPSTVAENIISELVREIIPFDQEHAYLTANLRSITKSHGLSLGDCACLSLGQIKNYPVLTADKVWAKIDHAVDVILIR